jgi:hypothetical protein
MEEWNVGMMEDWFQERMLFYLEFELSELILQ